MYYIKDSCINYTCMKDVLLCVHLYMSYILSCPYYTVHVQIKSSRLTNLDTLHEFAHIKWTQIQVVGGPVLMLCPSLSHSTYHTLIMHPSPQSQIETCNQEALKLATMINNRSPMLASDPFLSHLIAAHVEISHILTKDLETGGVVNPNSAHKSGLSFSVCILVAFCVLSIIWS